MSAGSVLATDMPELAKKAAVLLATKLTRNWSASLDGCFQEI